jgi:hypothetical protein
MQRGGVGGGGGGGGGGRRSSNVDSFAGGLEGLSGRSELGAAGREAELRSSTTILPQAELSEEAFISSGVHSSPIPTHLERSIEFLLVDRPSGREPSVADPIRA